MQDENANTRVVGANGRDELSVGPLVRGVRLSGYRICLRTTKYSSRYVLFISAVAQTKTY